MLEVLLETAPASVGAAVLVRLSGDLDVAMAHEVQEALLRAGDGNASVVVDLSDVTFLDCCGLGALVHARLALGGRLTLYEPSAAVLRLLDLCELRDTFVILDRRT